MKKLKSNEFTYDNTYVRVGSVTPSNPKHYMALRGNDKWENLRYVLEKKMGCFKFTLPMKVNQNSYLSAVFQYSVTGVARGSAVTSKTQVYSGDIVIVTRHPQPKHLHAYVPSKYWCDLGYVCEDLEAAENENAVPLIPVTEDTGQTEEEKLEALITKHSNENSTHCFLPPIVIRLLRQHILHPTDYATLMTPHPLFVCQYCGNQGKHFHTLCPFIETDARQNSLELVTKVRRLVGIPKSRLRTATDEEVAQGQYYLNETNEKVVVLKNEKVPPETKTAVLEEEETAVKFENKETLLPKMVVFYPVPVPTQSMEEYEMMLQFEFEDHLVEKDLLEQQREEDFYMKHPELRKKKTQICTHYYRGMCHKGKLECEFLHTGDENYIAICQFYVNDQCTELNCMFRHPPKHLFNNECNAYKRGFCEKGKLCKYKHVKYRHPSDNSDLSSEVCQAIVDALVYNPNPKKKR